YRRAVDMSAQGDEGGAAAIFEQLRERGEGSRYEARLRADASGAAALFGAAALVGALLLKTTHGGRDAQPAAPAGGHPAP
ncbi:hypothetical protein KKB55_10560, partial [Myxococcota bacterium]|nr:hypothetical protein [Myxococcota bacterium]